MSLAALTPQFGHEMEDSAMQEDHPADSAIAIDMESPKHHALTPQGTSYADTTAPTSFWSHSQSQETADQLVDVEFETAGAYEDDGMMAATEVEMTAAAHYEQDNELEMAYDNGQPEFHYEVEDSEVRDAELTYEEHSHQPHAVSHFVPLEHEQPHGIPIAPAPEPETFVAASDALPFAEAVVDANLPEEENRSEPAPVTKGLVLDSTEQHVPELAGETHAPESIAAAPVELGPDEEAPYEHVEGPSETHPPLLSPANDNAPRASMEAKIAEETIGTTGAEGVVAGYEASPREEAETESRFLSAAPPVLLTTISEMSKSLLVALFSEPDVAAIPSSSNAVSETPIVLLAEHHSLFAASVADLLAQLRSELLHAQPEIIPPSEFEYKEVQLIVRDLQLILTEDNIYSREISLLDLESMHRSCGLSGYLHLDFSLQPRFIDRYRAIRQAIEAHGTVNNTETATQQEIRDEEEREDIGNALLSSGQPKSPGVEDAGVSLDDAVEGIQPSFKQDEGDGSGAGEEDTGEPPLPLDDGEASSWSEEQDEDGHGATEEYQVEEGQAVEGWDDTVEQDTTALEHVPAADGEEGVYSEEYLHEDDYVPGDLLRIEEEVEYTADAAEELATEEYTVDVVSNEVNEAAADENEYDDGEIKEAATEAGEGQPEEHSVPSDAVRDAPEGKDENPAPPEETTEYDDETEWDDLGYNAEPDAINEKTGLGVPEPTQQVESVPNVGKETSNGPRNEHTVPGSPSASTSLPHRKRSFNEVEAEPEGNLTLSPGSKKARHL